MATPGRNRYAVFASKDDKPKSTPKQPVDLVNNPFLNQVADDSIPWEQVKKRGAPAAPPAQPVTHPVNGTKDQPKAAPVQPTPSEGQNRTKPASATDSNDKAADPHENWCGVCSIKLPNKAALLTHIKQSANHQHYCNLCKRVFKDRNGLKNHVDNSLSHETYCNLCLSAFKDQWGLKNHFENNYSVGHEFVCLTCLLGFRTFAELERHLQTAEKHTWCKACERRFRNQDERDEHWMKTNRHKHCLQPGCDFDGPHQAALAEHLRRDHFQCQGCKQILPSLTKLNQHYETCLFAISCPQCNEQCAGRLQLELHMKHCFLCEDCGFQTHHEGNYDIHMTKHSSASIPCWGCEAPMRKYSSLINHLESGNCPKLSDAALLMRCLGKWWYSALYMDLDMHANIRTGRVDIHELWEWMGQGIVHPFLCRGDECGKTFGQLSALLLHCESKACGWGVDRLNMLGLEKEFKQVCLRRDSATS